MFGNEAAEDQDLEDLLSIYKISLENVQKTEKQITAHVRELRKNLKSKKRYDPDKNCGVRGPGNTPCLRAVTCHLHKIAQKQEVPGRSDTIQALTKLHIMTRRKRTPKLSIPDNAGPVLLSPIKMILPKRMDDAIPTTSSQSDPEPSQVQQAKKSSRTSKRLAERSVAKKDAKQKERRSSRYSSQVQQLEKKILRPKRGVQCRACSTGVKPSSPILKQTLLLNNLKKLQNSTAAKSSYSILRENNYSSKLPATSTSGTPQFTVVTQKADVQELELPKVEANLLDPTLPVRDQEAVLRELLFPVTNQRALVLNQEKLQLPTLHPVGSIQFQNTDTNDLLRPMPYENYDLMKRQPPVSKPSTDMGPMNDISEIMDYCLIPPEATEIVDSLPDYLISEITETIIASMDKE